MRNRLTVALVAGLGLSVLLQAQSVFPPTTATFLLQTANPALPNAFAIGADPNADRIVFWDDSAGGFRYLTAGSGLTISGTTITAAGFDTSACTNGWVLYKSSGDPCEAALSYDAATNALHVQNLYIDHDGATGYLQYTGVAGAVLATSELTEALVTEASFGSATEFDAKYLEVEFNPTVNASGHTTLSTVNYVLYVPPGNSATLSNYDLTSVYAISAYLGTGTINAEVGLKASPINLSTGTVNGMTGVISELNNGNASGVVGEAYGMNVHLLNSGTITTTYGYYAGDITSGTQTNQAYSFYASDESARNYFGGTTAFGGLKTTGAAGSKNVVCVDTSTGQVYASSSGTDCSN